MAYSNTVKGIVIAGMLIFGTFTVVIQKIILSLSGTGRGGEVHKFDKPWFQTGAMFIGMLGCLVVYEVLRCVRHARAKKETQPLLNAEDTIQEPTEKKQPTVLKQYVIVILPAACDMIATAMMNIGLLWIAASIWQMLRGSMTIFSAIFSKVFLKRNLHVSHVIGVCVVAFALVVVALSALMPNKNKKEESSAAPASEASTTQQVIGCVLVVIAQIIQASQIVVEEFLLKEISLHPVLIVGLEGLWGTLMCCVLFTIVYYVPEPLHEDSIDTMIMLGKNPKILGFAILYAVVILCYNLFGMLVTQVSSAVIRTILEGLRTACIWVVNLFIHYVITDSFGEEWTDWSYLQVCGFLFLLLGMFVYNGIVRINGLYYDDMAPPAPKEDDEDLEKDMTA